MNPVKRRSARVTRGFTLIELMVTVVIITVLATLAYPGYRQIVQRSQRAQARAALLEAAMYMERFRAANHRYDLRLGVFPGDALAPVALPLSLRQTPTAGAPHYRLVLAHVDANEYRLEAHPAISDGGCGVLTLDQAGRMGAEGPHGPGACWK